MQNENMLEEGPQQQLLPNSIPLVTVCGRRTHGTEVTTGILLRGLPGAVKAGHSEQHSSDTAYGDVGGQGVVG